MSEQLNHGPVWYMRDNHTFRALKGGPESMVAQCLEEIDAGWDHGMLCSKTRGITVHANGKARRDEFAREAFAALSTHHAAPAGGVTPGAYLRKKAEDYAMEYGSDDMGGLSFGSGAHAEVKMDYYNNLLELAEELDALTPAARAVEPEAPLWAAGLVSESMVTAYLEANDQYWRETDALPQQNPSKWRNGTAREATRVSLIAALAASPTPPTCTACHGTGRVEEDQKVDNSGRTLPAWGCCDACEGTGKVEQQTPPTGTSQGEGTS